MRKGRQQGMVAHHGPAEWSGSRPAARPKLASPKPLSRRSAGLNRPAYFLALDSLDHGGTLLRSAVYLAAWYSFASPRAVVWQMYLVTAAIVYACTGQAYLLSQARAAATSGHVPAAGKGTQRVRVPASLLSNEWVSRCLPQVMEPSSAQLCAAVMSLISTLVARQSSPTGLLRLAQHASFARWGLEGFVVSESNRLSGVWLLARCADLQGLGYDVRNFLHCLAMLLVLGVASRAAALAAMLLAGGERQR